MKSLFLKTYPALSKVTEPGALKPSGNLVTENFAEADSMGTRYQDMDKLLGGQHQAEYERLNKIDAPRPVSLPKGQSIDLKALGAAGLNTSQLGAQPPPASR